MAEAATSAGKVAARAGEDDLSLVATAARRGLLIFGLSRYRLEILNRPGFEPHRL